MSPHLFYCAHLTVIAYALVGGVFLAFPDFIIQAPSLTGGRAGTEVMQVINREVSAGFSRPSSWASPPSPWR